MRIFFIIGASEEDFEEKAAEMIVETIEAKTAERRGTVFAVELSAGASSRRPLELM